ASSSRCSGYSTCNQPTEEKFIPLAMRSGSKRRCTAEVTTSSETISAARVAEVVPSVRSSNEQTRNWSQGGQANFAGDFPGGATGVKNTPGWHNWSISSISAHWFTQRCGLDLSDGSDTNTPVISARP